MAELKTPEATMQLDISRILHNVINGTTHPLTARLEIQDAVNIYVETENKKLKEALIKISQASVSGNQTNTIINIKMIASDAIANN